MAKSKSFFGLRKGSTKTMTYSVLKGQQITKDRVTDVANPKTQAQMIQRMIFAQAVKFYKQALANFFNFAFESKKVTESDYNAFVRLNVSRAIAVDFDNYNNPAYPSLGNFQVTQGSLQSPECEWADVDSTFNLYCTSTESVATIGQLSSAILAYYPGLVAGDIVTITHVVSALDDNAELAENAAPTWKIVQFFLDPNDARSCTDVISPDFVSGDGYVELFERVIDRLQMASVTFSRNTPSGLKVCDSYMIPSRSTWFFIESISTEAAKRQCAISWGATDPAILQGGAVNGGNVDVQYTAYVLGGLRVQNRTAEKKYSDMTFSPSNPPYSGNMDIKLNGTTLSAGADGEYSSSSYPLGMKWTGSIWQLMLKPNTPLIAFRELSINGKSVTLV